MITWHNPTDVAVRFEIREHAHQPAQKFEIPPHGELAIPAKYRTAIQSRRCDESVCRGDGLAWCQRGHSSGIIYGGLAPQLVEGE